MAADVSIVKIHSEGHSEDMTRLFKILELSERQSQIRDAANAEHLEDAVHHRFEKLDGFMQSFQEMIRSSISGSGIINLLQQQAMRLETPISHDSQDGE